MSPSTVSRPQTYARSRQRPGLRRTDTPDGKNGATDNNSHDEGSDGSYAPPSLLDFIGSRCMSGSSRFAEFFPCTVADVDDVEDRDAVDKLSREKAMNSMYATGGSGRRENKLAPKKKPDVVPASTAPETEEGSLVGKEEEEEDDARDDAPIRARAHGANVVPDDDENSTPTREEAPLIYSIPSAVVEDDDDSVVEASEASVEVLAPAASTTEEGPLPKKRKNRFGRKLFGRKKKAAA